MQAKRGGKVDGMVGTQREGLRERKRRETLQRIANVGLRLFAEHGYDATTLDAIAEAAGISRRTFFSYFKSKEDVLLTRHGIGAAEAMSSAMAAVSPSLTPLETARECLLELASRFETPDSIVADRLIRSTEALRARKEAVYTELESALVDALAERWPDRRRQGELRVVAMIAMGVLRLAQDAWRGSNAAKPLKVHLDQCFALTREAHLASLPRSGQG